MSTHGKDNPPAEGTAPRTRSNLRVDRARLWGSLMEMAEIGALPAGGCARLALTDEDRAGRDLFARWCEAAGCEVTVDALGNMFARRPGRDPPNVRRIHTH